MKKILSIIISVMMVVTMVPAMAFAAGENADVAKKPVSMTIGDVTTEHETLDDALAALTDQPAKIVLNDNCNLNTHQTIDNKNIEIDLNTKTLKIAKNVSMTLTGGTNVTFNNGSVSGKEHTDLRQGIVCVEKNSSVTLNKVNFDAVSAPLYPNGNAAKVVVKDSTVSGVVYAVATNAGSEDNHNVDIDLQNSTFSGASPVFINVPGKLNVKNCTINGEMHGVVVRGGTAKVEDTAISLNYTDSDAEEMAHWFDSGNWASGNAVNLAAITVGNKLSGSYDYPSNVTLTNVTAEVLANKHLFPAIYSWANETEGKGVNISYNNCTIKGDIVYGNDGKNIKAPITNGVFSVYPEKYIPAGYVKFVRADGLFAVGTDANKPANSEGMNTWTWNEKNNQYEESYVAPPSPSVPSTPEPEVAPPTVDAEGNIESTVKPDESGKVETTVPSETITESLDKVTQSPSEEKPVVEIVVKEEAGSKPADSVDVKVPAEAVDKVAKTEDASLKVTTSVGTVELDNDVLNKVASEANGEVITITIEKQDVEEITNEAQKETLETLAEDDHVFELTVKIGDRVIHQLGGKATFEIHYVLKEGELAENVRVYYIDNEGKKHRVEATYNEETQKIVMTTDHFSIFAVSYVDAPSKIKVLKASNEKGKAALRWSRATNGADGYRVYRAKTKDGKYSPIAWVKDGKAKTFKEKAKKTNKTYYYKVRAYKNVDGKKVWGEYSPVKKLKF